MRAERVTILVAGNNEVEELSLSKHLIQLGHNVLVATSLHLKTLRGVMVHGFVLGLMALTRGNLILAIPVSLVVLIAGEHFATPSSGARMPFPIPAEVWRMGAWPRTGWAWMEVGWESLISLRER